MCIILKDVKYRDYLYMLTIWILYFHATDLSEWFSDLLLVGLPACRHSALWNGSSFLLSVLTVTAINPLLSVLTVTAINPLTTVAISWDFCLGGSFLSFDKLDFFLPRNGTATYACHTVKSTHNLNLIFRSWIYESRPTDRRRYVDIETVTFDFLLATSLPRFEILTLFFRQLWHISRLIFWGLVELWPSLIATDMPNSNFPRRFLGLVAPKSHSDVCWPLIIRRHKFSVCSRPTLYGQYFHQVCLKTVGLQPEHELWCIPCINL